MSETVKYFFQYAPWFGALIVALLVLSSFMDWKIKEELKSAFLVRVYGDRKAMSSGLRHFPVYYDIVQSLFGLRTFRKFVGRSLLLTLLVLGALTFLQAIVNPDAFGDITAPFIVRLLKFDGTVLLLMLGVVIIDLISIYQTVTFLRISRGCNNLWEVSFLVIADLFLSLFLFILVFPLFVTAAFIVNAPTTSSFHVLMASGPTKQNIDVMDIFRTFLVFDPREKPGLPRDVEDDLLSRRWFFRPYSISLYTGENKSPNLADLMSKSTGAGSILLQTRGSLSDEEIFPIIVNMLKSYSATKEVRSIEVQQNFYTAYQVLYVSFDTRISFKYFWNVYAGLLKRFNFMDGDLFKIVALETPRITINDIAYQYNVQSAFSTRGDFSREQYVYCDGTYSVHSRAAMYDLARDFDKCAQGVAIDSFGFRNLRSVGLYSLASELRFPLSPLALSSLTATVMIYYLLFARIVFGFLRAGSSYMFKDGERLLRRHMFVVATSAGVIVFLPFIVLVRYLIAQY